MRKRIFTLFLFSLVAIFCGCFLSAAKIGVTEDLDVLALDQVVEMDEMDPYKTIYLSESMNKDSLLNKIKKDQEKRGNVQEEVETVSALEEKAESEELSKEELFAICEENDYFVMTTQDGYEIYYKYQLKALAVDSSVKENYGATVVKDWNNGYKMLRFETESETEYAYQQILKQTKNVVLDRIITTAEINNFEDGDFNSWGADYMGMDAYKNYYETNGADVDVTVAVFDTGINTKHEMFEGRLIKENGIVQGYCVSDIVTKYTYSGYSFEDDNAWQKHNDGTITQPNVPSGHGTHVSGIICDLTPSNVKILPVKVLNYYGSGAVLAHIDALYDVLVQYSKYNIVAINMSLGGTYEYESSASYSNMLYSNFFESIKEKNIVPVVAAGNDGASTSFTAPGGCDTAVVVASLAQSNGKCVRASYSNYGSSVDISAPGSLIKSAKIGTSATSASTGEYRLASGTSMACPHVAAAVALLCLDGRYYLDGVANYTSDIIEERLLGMAVDLGDSGYDEYYGYGLVNFKDVNGTIAYVVTDKTVSYDDGYHNISVRVTNTSSYTITYGFDIGACTISDYTTDDRFKNVTNGKMTVYFKITSPNYRETIGVGYLTINSASVTISALNQTGVYGCDVNVDQTAYSVAGRIFGDDDLKIRLWTFANKNSQVGSYEIQIGYSGDDALNYVINKVSGKFEITQRPITITAKNQTSVYGENINFVNTLYVVSGEIVDGDVVNVRLSLTSSSINNVGDYDIDILCEGEDVSNYLITKNKGKFIVTHRPITIVAKNQTSVYGETVSLDENKYEISGGVVSGDVLNISLSTTATSSSSVGNYEIRVGCAGDVNNYSITKTNGNLQITKRPITIRIGDQTSVYTQEVRLKNIYEVVSTYQIVNNDDLKLQFGTTANSDSPVGDYPIVMSGWNNDNYSVTAINGTYKIVEADFVITILPQTFIYGEEIDLDQYAFDVSIEIDKELLGVTLSTNAVAGSPVGNDYKIFGESSNTSYHILIKSGILTIKAKEIFITLQAQTCEYGNVKLDSSKFTSSQSVADLGLKLTSDATNQSNANQNYEISFEWSNKNYDVKPTNSALLFIQPRTLVVEINQSAVYGDNIVLNNSGYSIVSGSVVNEDDLSLNLSTNARKYDLVDVYKIKIDSANVNYLVYVSSDSNFRIVPRPITIITEQSKYYGDEVKLNSSKYVIVSGRVVNEDDLNLVFETSAKIESPVGTYPIDLVGCNSNYDVELSKGQLNVLKRILYIESIQSDYYGEYFSLNNEYKIIDGSVAFETDRLNVSFETDASMVSPVGEYELIMSYDNENYDIELTTISHFAVLPRLLTIKLTNQKGVYGEDVILNQQAYSIKSGNIVNGDLIEINLHTTADSESSVGEYELSAVAKHSNYDITIINGIFTVEKRQITIKINDQKISRAFGFNIDQNMYEIVDGNLVEDDELKLKILSDAQTLSMMGKYELTASYDNENYDVQIIEGELTLNFSVVDGVVVVLSLTIVGLIVLNVIRYIQRKRNNKKLFDRWINLD